MEEKTSHFPFLVLIWQESILLFIPLNCRVERDQCVPLIFIYFYHNARKAVYHLKEVQKEEITCGEATH